MGNVREQYIVDEKGTRTAVILSMKDYQKLLEDLHDLTIVAERHDEPTLPIEEVRQRLRNNAPRAQLDLN